MPERRMPLHFLSQRFALYLAVGFSVCNAVWGQTEVKSAISDHAQGNEPITTLRGCLGGGPGQFNLASAVAERPFVLTGRTSGLEKYTGREIVLKGREGAPVLLDGFFEPFPSFEVSGLIEVSKKWNPRLSPSFTNTSTWHTERNEMYGVEFAHPDSMTSAPAALPSLQTNFVTNLDIETVSTFTIPGDTYRGANLNGGSFTIFVNRNIANRQSCNQFGSSDPQGNPPSPLVAGEFEYVQMNSGGAAMGTWYSDYYFHSFQNGLCYELAFELVEYNAHNADAACNVPLLSEQDNLNLIKPLLARVSFFRPRITAPQENNLHIIPRVTEFTSSAQTADDVTNRGLITFSWSTENADYVELTYVCANPDDAERHGVLSVVISENGPNRYCKNTDSFKTFSPGHLYHSPNSSASIGFGFFNHDEPTSVVVTITPFSHGEAFPDSGKSLTVGVNPYNPFQRGVPTGTRNMTLTYVPGPDGTRSYQQGLPLTIIWTDERIQDPCVNLYLVQDDHTGGENYLLQINGKLEIGCLKPASRGSYAWTVTTKFLGSGFHVLASTPGGTSGTLGAPFDIVSASPDGRHE